VALITGAGSGIGRAAAVRFAAAGARVGLPDLDGEALAATAALLPGAPLAAAGLSSALPPTEMAVTVTGDIVDPATMGALVSEAAARFGRVDALFNNVGILTRKSRWTPRLTT
jgi:NAD(P)-dependent dehydrogenase (short-subunit alcohol dehydrogenase family)